LGFGSLGVDSMRKGQVETISIILIAGIIISLAGAAYFWGKPAIEKRSTLADIANAKSFMVQLDKDIIEVAKSGGTRTVSIPKISGSSISVDTATNEMLFRFVTTQAMLDMEGGVGTIPVETFDEDDPGPYGGSPRIITLQAEKDGQQYIMTLRLKYRELNEVPSCAQSGPAVGTPRGYKITLEDGGSTSEGSPGAVSVFFSGTETQSRNEVTDCGTLTKTKVRVTLS
jgi:hypothetical protein